MIDYADPGPSRDPDDFRRNSKDQPLVKHPVTGRDTPYDRPSGWFDDYTGIDPVYANRGTHVHRICEHIDNGVAWAADLAFVASGVALGIPADTQHDIAIAWDRFKRAHGLTIIANEATVVNDALRVAGTLDRIVEWQRQRCVLDIKTGSKVAKTAYAVQLARYAGSVPYDVHTDTRGSWGDDINQTVGIIAHLPLNAILKGSCGVEFELVTVKLAEGHRAAGDLYNLVNLDLSDDFTTIAPAPSHAGDAPTVAPHGTVVEHDAEGDGAPAATPASDPSLDELRATVRQWQPADRAALTAYFDRNDVDTSDAAQVAEAIDAVRNFHDVVTEPVTRPTPAPAPPPARDIDEGNPLSDAKVQAAGKRYTKLPDEVRSWVTVAGAKCRLSVAHGGKATERRGAILGALCEMAEQGFDDDDAIRAIVAHLLGDIAWQAGVGIADVVAAMDVAEAHRFAGLVSLVCMTPAAFEFPEGPVRCVLASSVAEKAAA